jgi:hypothetical protein
LQEHPVGKVRKVGKVRENGPEEKLAVSGECTERGIGKDLARGGTTARERGVFRHDQEKFPGLLLLVDRP